ncbi:MAG: glycosyltransferase [Clostridiales bacterium]|jgi:glycosyltransferase involved in cell wall biosynthesis/CubicO group peptidase (beta-lactamase class C family)|nr:glycosyltransferase [Clostridiales bacterium]
MLRVALTSDAFLPIMDGVGRVVYEYACGLSARGHECYVVAPMDKSGYRGRLPFEIIDFVSRTLPAGLSHYRTGVATLDRHYLERVSLAEFDIVHAHSPGPAGMEAVRLAAKKQIPLIGTFHSKFYDDFYRATRSDTLATLGLRYVVDFFDRCDEVWTVSNYAAGVLREYGFKGRIEIVQNGVRTNLPDIDRQQSIRRAHEKYKLRDVPILLYVGQMDWKKNLHRILEAASLMYRAGYDFQLVFAGAGLDESDIRALAQTLLPEEYVCFAGFVGDDKDLLSLYYAAWLFVFPSDYDTAGLVVREAAIAGTGSVVLKDSAPSEVITHNQNGFICENTPESLANTILQALYDKERLREIGENARRTIPISWDSVLDEVQQRYTALLERTDFTRKRKRGLFRRELDALDHSLEKRTLELVRNFLKQDMQNIYAYDYNANVVDGRLPEINHKPLPRSTPEQQGLFSNDLLTLYREVSMDSEARVKAMLLVRNGHVVSEAYWAPYSGKLPCQLYSMSKSVTATAIGLLVDEGKLQLNERLVDIFSDKVADTNIHPMRACTVWHLLTMSTGARYNEVGSALGADWEREFLDGGVYFEAGTRFSYNSMNTYMLSAIVKRKTGQGLSDYLHPRLFEPLCITGFQWECCPRGIEKGGWGLMLRLEDVAKIGLLYLQKGIYMVDGAMRRILSRNWVEEATRCQIETPHAELTNGYGYQIWMTPYPGAYLFSGIFGQYMLAIPDKNALVAIFSCSSRLFAQGKLPDYIHRCLENASGEPLSPNPRTLSVLVSAQNMLSMANWQVKMPVMVMPLAWLIDTVAGTSFTFDKNIASVVPVILQSVRNNFSGGVSRVTFMPAGDQSLLIKIEEGDIENTLELHPQGFSYGEVCLRQDTYTVSCGMQYGLTPAGEAALRIFVYYIETPCTRVVTFIFGEKDVSAHWDEEPAVQDSMSMLMELAGITQIEMIKRLMPILKRGRIQVKLREYTTSNLTGALEGSRENEPG